MTESAIPSNNYTIMDCFSFAKEALKIDMKSLFTNKALKEILNFCVQNHDRYQLHVDNLPKTSSYKLLKIIVSIIVFGW